MTGYLSSAVEMYQLVCVTATGKATTLKPVATPFVEEYQALAVAKVPTASGPCAECEWCGHTCPDSGNCKHDSYGAVKNHNDAAKEDATPLGDASAVGSGGESAADDEDMNTTKVHCARLPVQFW